MRETRAAASGEPLVQTRNLTKRYGSELTAVDGVDLTVRQGEVYGFLGPNGAGKTTTLRILVGLVRASSGDVEVLGRPPGHPDSLRRVGSLIESPAFYPYLSGRDNLRALAAMTHVPAERVDFVLDLVCLSDRATDKYSTYSLGMRQRLGVAAALLKDPELLILDEPTNGLDPGGMRDMRELIRDLGAGGYTVLLSSHLLGEVQQICDRVGVIARGRLIAEDLVDRLRGQVELVVAAEPIDRAATVLADWLGADQVAVRAGGLRVRAREVDPAEVNRALFDAGVVASELRREERSLEDVFFEMTGTLEGTDAG